MIHPRFPSTITILMSWYIATGRGLLYSGTDAPFMPRHISVLPVTYLLRLDLPECEYAGRGAP